MKNGIENSTLNKSQFWIWNEKNKNKYQILYGISTLKEKLSNNIFFIIFG